MSKIPDGRGKTSSAKPLLTKSEKVDRVLAQQRDYIAKREKGYREQALKLYPWICGRCSREFGHTNVRELTVHHVDHNHDNNPTDGSNWELLCIYCHDEEHSKYVSFVQYGKGSDSAVEPATHNPFAQLKQQMESASAKQELTNKNSTSKKEKRSSQTDRNKKQR
ncbi:MAG: HNH nuclease family protein [Pseudomonadales bacterium]|nr:HNH nuclease family protein [Pseudomonadales bacterium]